MSSIDYIIAAVLGFILSLIVTPIIIWLAKKLKIVDKPDGQRKIHKKKTPLLGGVALFISFNSIVFLYALFSDSLVNHGILMKNILGILIGGTILMIGGFLDDKYNLKPKFQLIFPFLAILSVIVSGIGIDWMTNPFNGEIWQLDKFQEILFWKDGIAYKITWLADLFTLVWLMVMMYTTKVLDGLDGLVSGITVIAGLFIFFASLSENILQTNVALLAIILVGVFLGFLVYNFNPAAVFLGEGGSLYSGFLLGVLSIISGSKVQVTLILMGLPMLDVLWTIIRRLMDKKSVSLADKRHLHHRFLAVGFSQKKTVFYLYFLTIIFGVTVLVLQNYGWGLLFLGILVVVSFLLLTAYFYKKVKEKDKLIV